MLKNMAYLRLWTYGVRSRRLRCQILSDFCKEDVKGLPWQSVSTYQGLVIKVRQVV